MVSRRTYLREWRKHSGLTQSQVIDRLAGFDDPLIPQTSASLSRIENGRQPYTQRILEALADIYQVDEPGWLLDRRPGPAAEIIDFLAKLDEKQQARALAVLEAMTREAV